MFVYIGSNETLKYSVRLANDLLNESENFKNKIVGIQTFDMTDPDAVSGRMIWDDMIDLHKKHMVSVKVYYPWYRFSKAYGYFTTARPFDINLNGYKLKRSPQSFVATLIHELVHMADNLSPNYYGHGDNSPIGKESTAPYQIGRIAGESLGHLDDNMSNYTYKKKNNLCRSIKKLIV